jgi:hypothetical protein
MLKKVNWIKVIKDVALIVVSIFAGAYNSEALAQMVSQLSN